MQESHHQFESITMVNYHLLPNRSANQTDFLNARIPRKSLEMLLMTLASMKKKVFVIEETFGSRSIIDSPLLLYYNFYICIHKVNFNRFTAPSYPTSNFMFFFLEIQIVESFKCDLLSLCSPYLLPTVLLI